MTNKEILEKAIRKAKQNGFDICPNVFDRTLVNACYNEAIFYNKYIYNDIIFSHDFAKAFWGEEWICGYCGSSYNMEDELCNKDATRDCDLGFDYPNPIKSYEYHLQQMVLEEDKLKYMEKFLDE